MKRRVPIARISPEGEVRALWDEALKPRETLGATPHRASRIEVVENGPHRGFFHVDFTPLYEMTDNPKFCVCLSNVFASYETARRWEVEWLRKNYIMEGLSFE